VIREALEWLAGRLPPPRVIMDRQGGSPYLSRYYLKGRPYMADGSSPTDEMGELREGVIVPPGIGVYLHKFHRGDDDRALHNHPWMWARSLILVGGYVEERRVSFPWDTARYRVARRIVRAGAYNRIDADDFHRVELLEKDCWSLFIAGPKTGSWGFWDRVTNEFLHWRDFIAKTRGPAWEGKLSK